MIARFFLFDFDIRHFECFWERFQVKDMDLGFDRIKFWPKSLEPKFLHCTCIFVNFLDLVTEN